MSDLISREDVLKALWNESWQETYDIIRDLPAVQPDPREAALRDIARQKKTDEMDTEYDVEYADFEGGYNAIIDVARVALRAVQPVTVRLVFSNADATPKTTVLDVSAASVPEIMAWYGAYCSGDRYTVTMDGRNVPMDQNGEPAHVNETPKSEHDARDVLTPATKGERDD